MKKIFKIFFMIFVGLRYKKRFAQVFFNRSITLKEGYRELSHLRQQYSLEILKYLNLKIDTVGDFPKTNRVLYIINHRSLLDILVMESLFGKYSKNGTWIAKEELFSNLIYGKFFKYSGSISVDIENKKGLLSFFKEIKNLFDKIDDFNLFMFPEGERNTTPEILEFQNGALKIAKANKLRVIPVFIRDNLKDIFENAPFEEIKSIEVYIGDEILDIENMEKQYRNFVKDIKR